MYEKDLSSVILQRQVDKACQIIHSGLVKEVNLIDFIRALGLKSLWLVEGFLQFPNITSNLHEDNFFLVHLAIAQGNLDIVKKLLSFPKIQQKLCDPNNEFILCAIDNNKEDIVRYLLTLPAVQIFLDANHGAIFNHATEKQCCVNEIYEALTQIAAVRNRVNPKKRGGYSAEGDLDQNENAMEIEEPLDGDTENKPVANSPEYKRQKRFN